jgi:UDP-N-acetylmuramyl pentapeptide phosphotransferase/UDP-N-acetylglucosamine-1-phosphate transferase
MSSILFYLLVFFCLFIIEYFFLAFARRKRIYDDPTDRSSHTSKTIRGGGIIFWFASLAIFLWSPTDYWLFFAGMTLVSAVSFIDDIHHLGQWPRFFSHVAGITCVLFFLNLYLQVPLGGFRGQLLLLASAYIVFVGVLNAWNFMDGINGINGLYSLALLAALQYVNLEITHFAEPLFIYTPMVACLVFLFFNFRKTALCFGGDVGSIAIAFWIVTLIMALMIETHTVIWLAFVSVYGIDSVFTILHRLRLRQNIFEPHRLHLYQVLANECAIDHRVVSTLYALLQLLVCAAVIILWDKMNFWALAFAIHIPLGAVYMEKFSLIKRQKTKVKR